MNSRGKGEGEEDRPRGLRGALGAAGLCVGLVGGGAAAAQVDRGSTQPESELGRHRGPNRHVRLFILLPSRDREGMALPAHPVDAGEADTPQGRRTCEGAGGASGGRAGKVRLIDRTVTG